MRADNARRPTGTGVIALAMVLITALLAARAPAQPPAQPTTTTPDTATTLAALARVERWVRAWEVPPSAEGVDPTPAVGAFVVLRSEGVIIARGEALSTSLSTPDPDALRRAAAQALERAAPKLSIPNDALREERLRELAKRISISLELAGDFALIEPATWDDVDLQLAPGLDGVAARVAGETTRGPGAVETVYPSTMLASAATGTLMVPSRALSVAAAQAIGEGGPAAALDTPAKLRAERAVRMYRFRVSHAVQGPAGTAPTVLYRGSRLVPPGWVPTRAELVEMGDRVLSHVLARGVPSNLGYVNGAPGPLRLDVPTKPDVPLRLMNADGTAVDDLEAALAALALRRFAWVNRSPKPEHAAAPGLFGWQNGTRQAESLSQSIISEIDTRLSGRTTVPIPVRVLAHAATENVGWPDGASVPEVVPGVEEGDGLRKLLTAEQLAEVPVSIAAFAIRQPGIPATNVDRLADVYEEIAVAHEDKVLPLLARANAGQLVGTLPALGWAALTVGDARAWERQAKQNRLDKGLEPTGRAALPVADEVPGAVIFRSTRSQLWQHQLTLTDTTPDTLDMVGGIVFTAGLAQGKSSPYPTWHGTRPLAFVATMLGDPRLTEPAERPRETVRLMQAVRFIRQLQVDEASAWAYPNPAKAIGGIRSAPWDFSQPVDASAMALMFITETIKSLDALAAQPADKQPAAPTPSAP